MTTIKKAINNVRDTAFAYLMGWKFAWYFSMRDNQKCLDILRQVEEYYERRYGSFTIWDAKDTFDFIDWLAKLKNAENYGFEIRLLRQTYDLELAERIKKKFEGLN